MKQHDPKNNSKKKFLRMPTYPGGKDAYLKFISENLVYPESALENKIEGVVYITYTVNNIGVIDDIIITKGIGYGCDEEAVRVIRMMKYEPARNRGIRMKVEMKTRIQFHLPVEFDSNPQNSAQITYVPVSDIIENSPEPKPQAVYNYTIKLS